MGAAKLGIIATLLYFTIVQHSQKQHLEPLHTVNLARRLF